MSAHVTDRVWLVLRMDGVELARVEAACIETDRSNGVAKFRLTGTARIDNVPMAIPRGAALLTIHDGPNLPPFGAMSIDASLWAGDTLELTDIKFEVLLDVPQYVKPEKPARPWRVRSKS